MNKIYLVCANNKQLLHEVLHNCICTVTTRHICTYVSWR